ncbi:MAG: hypothetical protein D6714_19830 [Bacteroidetes bacterium]|nr:MAG: hypothetical protein D6714_19830 [Bacteroidota bacterium]
MWIFLGKKSLGFCARAGTSMAFVFRPFWRGVSSEKLRFVRGTWIFFLSLTVKNHKILIMNKL